jgi:hypothetical protein
VGVTPTVAAGSLDLTGAADVPGAITADRVTARFRSASSLGNLQARTVVLRVRPPNPVEMVRGTSIAVRVNRIEADTVELDGVDVQFVRAREVTLGRGAHVTEWEGHVVRRHASARIGPESRTPPPYGLSR